MPSRREFLIQATSASAVAAASMHPDDVTANTVLDGSFKIPRTDLIVSRIAYGAAMLLTDQRSSEFVTVAMRAMRTAYENGVTFFDLADVYGAGQSELALGGLLRNSPSLRDRIVIQSKCGARFASGVLVGDPDEGNSIDFVASHAHIISAVEATLKRLGIDHLDILLLHAPDPLIEPEQVARAFYDLRGKVRYFGVSNYNINQIELLKRYVQQPLVVNQIRLSLPNYSPIIGDSSCGGIVDYCRAHEMQVQAYSPLKWNDKLTLLNPPADATSEVKKIAKLLMEIGHANTVSPAAVMLAWLMYHPAHIIPVIGASKPEHIIDNCAAGKVKFRREEWISLLRMASKLT